MECAGKGRGTRCTDPPTRRCSRCEAVAYCSLSHQISHWSDHKEECERLEQQMDREDELNDFPFTYTQEATFEIFEKRESRCSFLSKRGIHRLGMWMCECSCGSSLASYDCLRSRDEGWNLSSSICPCRGPAPPISKKLSSWVDYCEWRHIPLHSPVALILHWPLTIYYATQVALMRSSTIESCNELFIHYLGPEKELFQLAAFGELHALFPGMKVHIELIGPAIPEFWDGQRIDLCSYAHCSDADCICRTSSENVNRDVGTDKSSEVILQLHRGYYHDHFGDLIKGSFPHLIVAPNAGVAAYPSWLPTVVRLRCTLCISSVKKFLFEAGHWRTCESRI